MYIDEWTERQLPANVFEYLNLSAITVDVKLLKSTAYYGMQCDIHDNEMVLEVEFFLLVFDSTFL